MDFNRPGFLPGKGESEMKSAIRIISRCLTVLFLLFAVHYASADSSYAEDRAEIENLAARYLFALDFRDAKTYSETFTEDGILDYGRGEVKGRKAIFDLIDGMNKRAGEAEAKDTSGLRPPAGRHNISNMVIKVDGNTAKMVAYWFHHGNDNPERTSSADGYGHYVDELVRVNGHWLFKKRKIYNEQVDEWASPPGNPAW